MSKLNKIRDMFELIAPTYDLLNHLLSFGLDILWRKKAIKFLSNKKDSIILDIAAGSGDFSIEALKIKPQLVIAIDFADNMLEVFSKKLKRKGITNTIKLVNSDAHQLPFKKELFDISIVAFGFRNFTSKSVVLREISRVIKPKGTIVILELTEPTIPVIRHLYKIYSFTILPFIGKIISQHNNAYHYLPTSISAFPKRNEFTIMMEEAGFKKIVVHTLSLGIATLFIGEKGT